MKKNLAKDEIDLLDVILIVWKKKFQVAMFILVSIAIVLISEKLQKPKFLNVNAITEIKPISVYDEAQYKIYSSIINRLKPFYVEQNIQQKASEIITQRDIKYKFIETEVKELQINNIDKEFLLELFIDNLNEEPNLISLIKEFDYIKRENYPNKIEYEKAVDKMVSSISFLKGEKENETYITISNFDIENWENFLKFVEKKTNFEIQKNLNNMFTDYLNYVGALQKFEMEDIETQLIFTSDEERKLDLENKKKILMANKYIDRMQDIFNSSAISKPNEFYAAKVNYKLTKYEITNNKSLIFQFLVGGICGAILGIFFVLIVNAVQKRK